MYQIILEHLSKKQALTKAQVQFFIESSISEELSDEQKGKVLTLLQDKGVTAEEISFFVNLLSVQMPTSLYFPEAVDICGTGGSGLDRINTSTISAFILSALDVPIAKHGNKAASGRFGSFDLLEEIGLNIYPAPEILSYAFWKEHLAFLFARSFHPAMKHFGKVRQDLGIPTIFNILGPLLSPVQAKYQAIGTSFEDKMELIAQGAQNLGKEKVLVVRGEDGLDEVTLCGSTSVVETPNLGVSTGLDKYKIHPSDFGIEPVKDFSEISGGDKHFNIQITKDILQGKCASRHVDLVLVNTAIVLNMMGRVSSLREGYQQAKEVIDSGKAWKKFLAYKDIVNTHNKLHEIVGNKYQEIKHRKLSITNDELRIKNNDVVETRFIASKKQQTKSAFKQALSKPGLALIAEIKKASPSKGIINEDIDVVEVAKKYEACGASAISVLTDSKYFHGSLDDLRSVTKAVNIPVLRKDFIIDVSQIYEAAAAGASAILLMASVLDKSQIIHFLKVAKELGLDCLVEVHSEEELKVVLETEAEIIGVNNRDLRTLEIDLKNTEKIVGADPCVCPEKGDLLQGRILISESGIKTPEDIQSLPRRIDGVLVGSSIMENNIETRFIASLTHARKLFKACGIRTIEDAKFCEENNIDMIGLNFVPTSNRAIDLKLAKAMRPFLRRTKIVGVFQNQSVEVVNQIAEGLNLDYIQLAGDEDLDFIKSCNRPVIKTIKLHSEDDIGIARNYLPYTAYIIFDGREPGSGELINYKLLKKVDFPYILAGGVTTENITKILQEINPIGIDVASGIEKNGKVSQDEIKVFLSSKN